jgi:hypothetical protein
MRTARSAQPDRSPLLQGHPDQSPVDGVLRSGVEPAFELIANPVGGEHAMPRQALAVLKADGLVRIVRNSHRMPPPR